MGMLKEFREFAVKGNAVDMAVGIVIGAAFGKVVTSLVNDIIMPPIGMLVGRVNFSSLAITLNEKDRHQVRSVSQQCSRFPDRGLLHLPGGQADEPAEAEAGRAGHEELPAVPIDDSHQGRAMRVLHVARGELNHEGWGRHSCLPWADRNVCATRYLNCAGPPVPGVPIVPAARAFVAFSRLPIVRR